MVAALRVRDSVCSAVVSATLVDSHSDGNPIVEHRPLQIRFVRTTFE